MNIEIVQKLLLFIKNENSGTPSELATKLNMSERMIYKYISFLKTEFNAPVKYCRKKKILQIYRKWKHRLVMERINRVYR